MNELSWHNFTWKICVPIIKSEHYGSVLTPCIYNLHTYPWLSNVDTYSLHRQWHSRFIMILLKWSIMILSVHWRCRLYIFASTVTHSNLNPLYCSKLWNQVPSLDHFVIQNSGDFLCWKYKEVVCFYVSNLRQ